MRWSKKSTLLTKFAAIVCYNTFQIVRWCYRHTLLIRIAQWQPLLLITIWFICNYIQKDSTVNVQEKRIFQKLLNKLVKHEKCSIVPKSLTVLPLIIRWERYQLIWFEQVFFNPKLLLIEAKCGTELGMNKLWLQKGLVIRPYFWLFIRPFFFSLGPKWLVIRPYFFFEVPKWLSIKPFSLEAEIRKTVFFPDLVVYKTFLAALKMWRLK